MAHVWNAPDGGQVSRETGVPVNRKQAQRIYRKTGYIDPQKTKNDIIRTKRRLFKPEAPYEEPWQKRSYFMESTPRFCNFLALSNYFLFQNTYYP